MLFGLSCFKVLVVLATIFIPINGYLHPITIHGRYFIDSITKEPFFLKGVDYQPGGSSGVSVEKDPLSDPDACARDVILFQELGINTVRVYSINPDLNHDVCMTLLAMSGIYLVLDVNSPLVNQHLNRYEPWTTYNVDYLEHVFKVVEQFSYYNNTLGFFAGNEIINDKVSAKSAPVYIKALIRDMKTYIEYNSPRPIPVGYSAADDLNYRIPLSEYLECVDENPAESVDFYGVNTYQWCGEQTFYTSGYNLLCDDYSSYSRPVFFSEYGCNEVTPRIFEEVQSIYSNDMIDVFSGGLVYEFSQEPNNFGLVEHTASGNVKILPDFVALKTQFQTLPELDYSHIAMAMRKNSKDIQSKMKSQKFALPKCEESYHNLDISNGLPMTLADDLIDEGVEVQRGRFLYLKEYELGTAYKIFDIQGVPYPPTSKVEKIIDIHGRSPSLNVESIKTLHRSGSKSVSSSKSVHMAFAVLSVLVPTFAIFCA